MQLSVIIPTYNRKNSLIKCLDALFNQTYSKSNFEIIIIDDGSTDGTEEVVKSVINDSLCKLKYLKQENKGPSAARNLGIKSSSGDVVIFIGDDIIATETLLSEHAKWHKKYPEKHVAILGYITWPPDFKITPFMKYIDENGIQFGFKLINNKEDVPYNFFYTSNISLKRVYLLENGLFDEDFPYAAWEDIELSYRLKKKGLRIVYNSEAVAYHHHAFKRGDYCRRMEISGNAAKIFKEKHPEFTNFPKQYFDPFYKSFIKHLLWHLSPYFWRIIPRGYLYKVYQYILISYFQKGYNEYGKRDNS